MNTSVISGLIGGVVSVILCTYISNKVRNSTINGQLRFNSFLFILALGCLLFSSVAFLAFIYDKDVWQKSSEFIAVLGLFIGFGIGSIYCFGEYFRVFGSYDNIGIQFHTPWSGSKSEKWDDLVSVNFNSTANWYVLEFKSGAKIRLSTLLSGYGKVLELISEKGLIIQNEDV